MFSRIFPIFGWLSDYSGDKAKSDLSAGLTTTVMLIPQGMAYAMLAGIPPIMGLYAATVPLLIYAILGTSGQLALGPMAMTSLLVAAGINELIPPDQLTTGAAVQLTIILTLLVGVFQLLLAVLRLGGLVNLLSHPVVSGFTGAAGIIIGVSQLQHLVGFTIPRGLGVIQTVGYILNRFTDIDPLTMGVGGLAVLLIVGVKKLSPQLPAALIAVVIGIVLSWFFDLEGLGVNVLGNIPSGLPSLTMPALDLTMLERAAPMGLTIALIGFMESISVAKTFARQYRYDIRPGQELTALGMSNIASGLFGGYIVGGALSRSAVNAQAGARTPVANVVTAAAIGLTLAFLTPLFYFLPTPILAAIILVAVSGLIDVSEAIHLWKVKRDDLVLLVITFFATLFLTIELGILIGVGASLLWLVYTTTRPVIAVVGRLPGTRSYRDITHFEQTETFERILILRMDAQFFFGNVVFLKDTLFSHLDKMERPIALVIDASAMNGLDSTAADTLYELISELRRMGVEVFISHVKGAVLEVMFQTEIIALLGDGHLFYEVEDAVQAALRHRDADEQGIPLEEEDFGHSDIVD
ncbi:MAG: sulfate permease [Myxococcota bacterium]|nr:sulfate permease [Myxococcota bacterium]